jgi:hypothetical protein
MSVEWRPSPPIVWLVNLLEKLTPGRESVLGSGDPTEQQKRIYAWWRPLWLLLRFLPIKVGRIVWHLWSNLETIAVFIVIAVVTGWLLHVLGISGP